MANYFTSYYNYWVYIALMMIGFYGIIAKRNLVKQAIALSLFQTGIFLFYISMAVVVEDGKIADAPIYVADQKLTHELQEAEHDHHLIVKSSRSFSNPLPHVLILTAIVVSVSILAVALAIIVNIKRAYGTIEEDEIQQIEMNEAP